MHVSAFSLNLSKSAGWIAPVAALLLIYGCAAPKSALLPEIDAWETRTLVLAALDDWQFHGRIAVRSEIDGFNGKLRWTQDKDEFSATASGPLGAGAIRIEGDNTSVVLTDKHGVRTILEDAEVELHDRYGWTIPVASLRYWALGIPDPRVAADTVFNESGQLERLQQRGWSVIISRYAEGGGQLMPKVLTAENTDTRVRLVIDHWVFFD
jgi:outer membrane lipoprotein LolB